MDLVGEGRSLLLQPAGEGGGFRLEVVVVGRVHSLHDRWCRNMQACVDGGWEKES